MNPDGRSQCQKATRRSKVEGHLEIEKKKKGPKMGEQMIPNQANEDYDQLHNDTYQFSRCIF